MLPSPNTLLETDLIRTFVAISELGNFSAAASRVNRTPSAISMQVKKLEEQLGRTLFNREGRMVTLTTDGETLLGFARDMLKLNDQAVSRFRGPAIEGSVCFGAPDDFGTRFLPQILKRFASTHPLVEVNVTLGPSEALLENLAKGQLDMTLLTAVPGGINDGIGEVVHSERLVWTGVKGGTAHKLPVIPLALAGKGCCWRGAAVEAFASSGIKYRIAYTCENCQGQLAALLGDLAIAPLPESLITPQFERLGEKHALPDMGTYDIRLHTAEDMGKESGRAAKAFSNHVRESFKSI
ncbi:MAG: LysR family transcriptional regulator [Pseudomonadota bacterium]